NFEPKLVGDDVFGGFDGLREREVGGVEHDRVWSGLERRVSAISIALIARVEFANDVGGLHGALGTELIEAAHAADFRSSVEKDLGVGMREDNGADVAAFHDYAACRAHLLLQANHP